MAGRHKIEETEGRVSIMRVLDDTLEEVGLPGLRDLLPPPQELLSETVGIPSPNDWAQSIKERLLESLVGRQLPRPPRLPRLP